MNQAWAKAEPFLHWGFSGVAAMGMEVVREEGIFFFRATHRKHH